MNDLDFNMVTTLGAFQEEDTMFIVQLMDISQELAAKIIRDIRNCKGLDDVICRYSGDHKTGMAEFSIKKEPYDKYLTKLSQLSSNGPTLSWEVSKTEYHHLITMFCAALSQSLTENTTAVEQKEPFQSLIFDSMFSLNVFNCISSRLRLIDRCKSESRDFVENAKCAFCPLKETGSYLQFGAAIYQDNKLVSVNRCGVPNFPSESLNRILGYLIFDDLNRLLFVSRVTNDHVGLLTYRSNRFSNLTGWLDLEQFLDINGLF